jgi:hypothetical protein
MSKGFSDNRIAEGLLIMSVDPSDLRRTMAMLALAQDLVDDLTIAVDLVDLFFDSTTRVRALVVVPCICTPLH